MLDAEFVFGMFKRLHGKEIPAQAWGPHFARRWLNVMADASVSGRPCSRVQFLPNALH